MTGIHQEGVLKKQHYKGGHNRGGGEGGTSFYAFISPPLRIVHQKDLFFLGPVLCAPSY